MTWLDDATVEGRNLRAVLGPAVQTARLTRSLTEASTVELGVLDPSRELLRSDLWRTRASLVADGRRYVLKRRRKTRYTFDLTFEDIIAYTLKAVTKQRVAARNKQSRIEFVIRAITATGIKAYAPTAATAIGENSAQFTPATGADRRNAPGQGAPQNGGFIEGATVTVTNHGQPDAGRRPWTPANGEQLRSLVIAFDTATAICQKLKLTAEQTQLAEVAMVAAGSAESGWYKAAHNDVQGGHSGIYQQSPRYYTGPSDVAISTQEFLLGASTYGKPAQYFAYAGSMIALLQGFTGQATTLGAVIASRQGSDQGASYYDDFVAEARQTVSFWQANGSSASTALPVATKPGQWTQGTATTSESVWDMGQRLMQEQGWRMFVGPHPKTGEDVVYLVPDEWLFNRAAAATISENDGAVDTIDWTIDDLRKTSPAAPNRKPMDSCTVHAFDTWNVQPGSLVRVAEDSPADGKWLVLSWERDAVKPDSTIELGAPVTPPQPPQPAPSVGSGTSGSSSTFDPGAPPVGGTAVGDAVAKWALSYAPSPPSSYVWGAKHGVPFSVVRSSPHPAPPFDCSSFVRWGWIAEGAIDVGSPGGDTTYAQIANAKARHGVTWGGAGTTPRDGFKPGDLVYTSGGGHVVVMINAAECVSAESKSLGINRRLLSWHSSVFFWARWSGADPV